MAIDPSASVAPTAIVHPEAVIGPQSRIAECAVVERDVVIGARCLIEPHVYVKRWTSMGDDNEISAGTVLGSDPLDKSFGGERSYLRIGNGNKIREHYTVSRGTAPESATVIGDSNYIMTSGHIAHNCTLGSGIVLASTALVAGHVVIEDQAFISGGAMIHQFSKVGRLAMISGNVKVNMDAPPFMLFAGFDIEPAGLNLVGLKRAGFSAEAISSLKRAYHLLYHKGLQLEEALERIEREVPGEHARHLVAFVRSSKRGICRPGRSRNKELE